MSAHLLACISMRLVGVYHTRTNGDPFRACQSTANAQDLRESVICVLIWIFRHVALEQTIPVRNNASICIRMISKLLLVPRDLEFHKTRCEVWDARAFKKPVMASPVSLPSFYPEADAVFSPDERYIACGRSAEGRGDRGALVILQRDTLEVQRSVECDPGVSVVRVVWHSKINQVNNGCSCIS